MTIEMLKTKFSEINGLLLLDKPINISSNQALQKAKRIFHAAKAGHTGNLDVLATGLLPICFGEATKFSQFLLDADKGYTVSACLGKRTTTLDAEGEVIEEKPFQHITQELLENVLNKFKGNIQQVPPMYSALKHQGQKLYDLARKGIEIDRKTRAIFIDKINLLEFQDNHFSLEVSCSKGTYIRTLIDDIGQALNSCAYVTALRRTHSGHFNSEEIITLETLGLLSEQERLNKLIPMDKILNNYAEIRLTELDVQALYQGKIIRSNHHTPGFVRLYDQHHQFVGMGEVSAGNIKVKRLCKLN